MDRLDFKNLFKQILHEEVSFDGSQWPHIGTDIKDLINKMLHKDAEKRIKVKDAITEIDEIISRMTHEDSLHHKSDLDTDEHLDVISSGKTFRKSFTKTLDKMRIYSKSSLMMRIFKNHMAKLVECMPNSEMLNNINKKFLTVDADNTGLIDHEEFHRAYGK